MIEDPLQGCYCERLLTTGGNANGAKQQDGEEKSVGFLVANSNSSKSGQSLLSNGVTHHFHFVYYTKLYSQLENC